MVDREKVREYVTTVWNYNQSVVDAFDEEDYKIVNNTASFQIWLVKKLLYDLGIAVFEPFNKIKKAFK